MVREKGVEKWCALNRQGLIPGPEEEEKEFVERVAFCLGLKDEISKELLPKGDELLSPEETAQILGAPLAMTSSLYDIRPAFPPLFFSNWRLFPWHGGSAWIFQLSEKGPLGAFIQMRKALYKKTRYLGLYEREELIAHELCHVGRMAFQEKKYEELLAFRTSKRLFSRYLGPLLQSAHESHLFIFTLIALLMLDLFFLFQGAYSGYLQSMWLKLIPFGLIGFALFRLSKRQRRLEKALSCLKLIFGAGGEAVLYRLKDSEIDLFAVSSLEEVSFYIARQTSFRWQVISACYPKRYPRGAK